MAESVTFGGILIADMPSAKVASTIMFGVHIHYRVQHLAPVLHLYTAHRFRKLRWSRHIKKQRAMSTMCNDITACKASTVVAFGDATFRHYGRAIPPNPYVMLWGKGATSLMWMNSGPAHCVVPASTECRECLFPLP